MAKTVYVSKAGNDSNDGLTVATAKLTIAGANAIAVATDTVSIGIGTWTETDQIASVSNCTYQGAGMFSTTIIGSPKNSNRIYLINDMRINPQISPGAAAFLNIANNSIYNRVYFDGGAITLTQRPIDYNGSFTMAGCIWKDFNLANIYWCLGSAAATIKLYNTSFYNAGARTGDSGSFLYGFSHNVIAYVKNCIFHTSGYGAFFYPGSVGAGSILVEENNCRYTGYSDIGVTNGVVANPLFVDPAGGDFRLQATSPCIGKGTSNLP